MFNSKGMPSKAKERLRIMAQAVRDSASEKGAERLLGACKLAYELGLISYNTTIDILKSAQDERYSDAHELMRSTGEINHA